MCLAAAEFLSISCGANYLRALYYMSRLVLFFTAATSFHKEERIHHTRIRNVTGEAVKRKWSSLFLLVYFTTVWSGYFNLFRRFCNMFQREFPRMLGCTATAMLPSKQGELSENILQNLRNKLPPQTVNNLWSLWQNLASRTLTVFFGFRKSHT